MKPLLPFCLMFAVSGCVTKTVHDAALTDAANKLRTTQDQAQQKLDAEVAQRRRAEADLATCKQSSEELERKLTAANQKLDAANQKLDAASALTQRQAADLDKCGKKMKDETGALAAALAETKAALEEARKAKAAAEARAQLFKKLTLKFQKMIDAGSLKIALRNGRMVLQLANDVLFDSGKTDLKPAGQEAIKQVTQILSSIQGRNFQVTGHTDNIPIGKGGKFKSNWELSAQRAVEIVKFMANNGMDQKRLSAAGYADQLPVASNDDDKGRSQNRRIEIVVVPNIEELPGLDEVKSKS